MTESHASSGDEPEFIGFVLSHKAFRAELPRLVTAFQSAPDRDGWVVVEDHLRLITDHLIRHHEEEDTFHWPLLLDRCAESVPLLHRLEAEHIVLDALIETVRDRTLARSARADALVNLERLVRSHTEAEEVQILPLLMRCVIPQEQAGSMARSRSKIPADDELRVLALMLDAGSRANSNARPAT